MSVAAPPSSTSDPRVRGSGVSPTDDPGQAAEVDVTTYVAWDVQNLLRGHQGGRSDG